MMYIIRFSSFSTLQNLVFHIFVEPTCNVLSIIFNYLLLVIYSLLPQVQLQLELAPDLLRNPLVPECRAVQLDKGILFCEIRVLLTLLVFEKFNISFAL